MKKIYKKIMQVLLCAGVLPLCSVHGQKETILMRSVDAIPAIRAQNSPSLPHFLQQLGPNFTHYLNETGRFAIVSIDDDVDVDNLFLELDSLGSYKVGNMVLRDKPTHKLQCTVTTFVERNQTIREPFSQAIVINRDLDVTVTMKLSSIKDSSDQRTFLASYQAKWDERFFPGATNAGPSLDIVKIGEFAKSAASQMSQKFLKEREELFYVILRDGAECSLAAGTKHGVKLGQQFKVGAQKKVIHPVTGKEIGVSFSEVGVIQVTDVRLEISTCSILQEFGAGIVTQEPYPVAKPLKVK
jgi:hypothetical protein